MVGLGLQLLLWVTMLFILPAQFFPNLPAAFLIKHTLILCILITLYYLNSMVWVPNYLLKSKTTNYIGMVIGMIFIIMLAIHFIEIWLHIDKIFRNENASAPQPGRKYSHFRIDYFTLLLLLIDIGISTSIALFTHNAQEKEIKEKYEKEKISSELDLLKSQINPHFFFNTLNNIYALTSTQVSLAQKAILTLSKMMRYVLYDSHQDKFVLLSQEILFIENYIELVKFRLTDKVKINFIKPSPLKDHPLSPMILMPFVENAFKYGVKAGEESSIDISVSQSDTVFSFQVKNKKFANPGMDIERHSGMGISHTRRMLDLVYPGKHDLKIIDNAEFFEVNLSIQW